MESFLVNVPGVLVAAKGYAKEKQHDSGDEEGRADEVHSLELIPSRFSHLMDVLIDRMIEEKDKDQRRCVKGKGYPINRSPRSILQASIG